MAWTAPNTTWIPGAGIADTDLNPIGENLVYLKTEADTAAADIVALENTRQVSASVGGESDFSLTATTEHRILRLRWYLLDDREVVLTRASYHFTGSTNMRMRVYNGASYWTSVSSSADETPVAATILSNTTGSPAMYDVDIEVYNGGGSSVDVYPEDGAWLVFTEQSV